MKIGELAKRAGLSAHTLRYYERIGLLPRADRDASGQRDYDASILVWIGFLERLKTTGMPIREMLRYAALREQGPKPARRAVVFWKRIGTRCAPMWPIFRQHFSSSTPRSAVMPRRNRGWKTMMRNSPISGESRLERGRRALAEIDGAARQNVIEALAGIAPDFATYLFEFPFGDIYCRPGLSLRDREIATIAALAAMGTAAPQLKVHIEAGLNVGISQAEITEILMQMAVYAGFPAALNGLLAAKEVFARQEAKGGEAGA